jgi:putative aldouronate transport system substrate-binding protein
VGDADRYITAPDLMMPLNDLLAEYGQDLLRLIPEEAWIRCTNTKGEIMYIPDYYQWRWQGCVIRTDLLAEQGLGMPTNIAELENVMEVFKNAYPDMIPATGLPWFSDPFLQGSQDSVASWMTDYALDAEGNVVPSRTLPEYKKMIMLYKKWVENGWYDAEFMSGNDESQSLLWNTGRVGIWFCDPHRALDWNYDSFKLNFPDGTGDFLPVPKNEAGEKKFPISYGVGVVAWITEGSEHAADIVKYFNKQISDLDFYVLGANGIEGVHWLDSGEEWDYPEGMDANAHPYDKLLAPLAWEFLAVQKPRAQTRPEVDWVHDALNEEYATADLILTGLEGFTPDNEPVSMYNPIDLDTYLPSLIVTDISIDEFDNIIDQWYNTGGREIVEEYTRQYNEWRASQ